MTNKNNTLQDTNPQCKSVVKDILMITEINKKKRKNYFSYVNPL